MPINIKRQKYMHYKIQYMNDENTNMNTIKKMHTYFYIELEFYEE